METFPERQSGVNRILKSTPEQEAKLLKLFGEKIKNQDFHWYERKKTSEELMTIEEVLIDLPSFVQEYGGRPLSSLTPEIVHIIDIPTLSTSQRETLELSTEVGWYLSLTQEVMVIPNDASLLSTAHRIVHELMHLESYTSLQVQNESNELVPRRIGLSVLDRAGKKRYFKYLEEAIVEELVRRFDARYFGRIEPLQDDWQARARLLPGDAHQSDIAAIVTKQLPNGRWQATPEYYLYPEERKKLKAVIAEIYAKHRSKFKSEEDVFRTFAKATLTGNMLPLGRLVEATFGRGALRRLAEETKHQDIS